MLTLWAESFFAVEWTQDAAASAVEDMGVDHRRRDILVPQQLLHGPDVVAGLQQVGCKGMSPIPISA